MLHPASPSNNGENSDINSAILIVSLAERPCNPLAALADTFIDQDKGYALLSRFESPDKVERAQRLACTMARCVLENIESMGHSVSIELEPEHNDRRDFYFDLDEPVHFKAHQKLVDGITDLTDYKSLAKSDVLEGICAFSEDDPVVGKPNVFKFGNIAQVGEAVMSVSMLTHPISPYYNANDPRITENQLKIAGQPYGMLYHVEHS